MSIIVPVPYPSIDKISESGKIISKEMWLTEQSVRTVYDKYAEFFPIIIKNWHPVNGHSQEVAAARLHHFKEWFGIGKPPAKAFSCIMKKCLAKTSHLNDPMRHLHHIINNYFWWTGGLFGNFPPSHFWRAPYICRSWNYLVDEVGENNTDYKKFHVNLDLSVWLTLSAKCIANEVEIEKLTLLTFRMEELAYRWECQLKTDYDAPSSYTNIDFNKWLISHPYAGKGALYLETQEEKWGIMNMQLFEAENSTAFENKF